MIAANDNIRHEIYDDPGLSLLRQDGWLRKKLAASFIESEIRGLMNFLWFSKFEASFRRNEAEEKRREIHLVKTDGAE